MAPKSYRRRWVKLPRFVTEMLAPVVAGDPDELVFTSAWGKPLRGSAFRTRVWAKAVRQTSVPGDLTPHHLRHTCASILIRQGASVKAVQTQLGHAKPSITLDVYSHLFGDELDNLYGGIDARGPVSPEQVPAVTNLDGKRASEQGR